MLALMPKLNIGHSFTRDINKPTNFKHRSGLTCDVFESSGINKSTPAFKGKLKLPLKEIRELNQEFIKYDKIATLEEMQNTLIWDYSGKLGDITSKFQKEHDKPGHNKEFIDDFVHELGGAYFSQQIVNLIQLPPHAKEEGYKIGMNIAKHTEKTINMYQKFIDNGFDNPKKQFKLNTVFNYVKESVAKKTEAKNIKLVIENEELLNHPKSKTRLAYKNYIIMSNLIENAIKYSPENSEINVAFKKHKNNVYMAVKDHGIGIPESEQGEIMLSVNRGSNVGDIKGTGHGLYRIHKIMEAKGLSDPTIKSPLYPQEPKNVGTEIETLLLTNNI